MLVHLGHWLADWCANHEIAFVLGHALYMKAIHGGKAKNDRIDSEKIARRVEGRYVAPSLCLSSPHACHS